ncbi:MAG: putative Ig domain-containing protein, partial [Chloroflexota bacterium]
MLRRLLSNYSSTHNGQRAALLLILTILLSLGISSQIGIVRAATITVTQNDDAGDGTCDATCTLPEAILQANFNGGGDTIEFAVNGSGSAETIFLTAPLPDVQVQVTIDGSTQGGGGCSTPPITIDGTPVGGDGLVLGAGADGSSIQGLNITKFGGSGIVINGASNNLIQCNSLSANSSGVNVVSGSGNTISQNSIFSNAGAGITLGGGANGGQTAPALTLAQSDGATGTTVTGTLTSTASSSFTIEFFQCDSTPDEGQTPIGTTALGTDGAGAGAINISSLASLNVGDAVSATATNTVTGDTSRFSACEPVVGKPVYQSSPAAGGSPLNISTNLGTPASTTINITNLGNATLNITGVNLSDTTNFTPIFTPIFAPTPPFSVTAGDVTIGVNIEIQCNALAVTPVGSPVTTTLTVPNNAGPDATYTIECDVAAAAAPDYDSVPPVGSTIAFGPVTVGSSGTFSLEIDSVGTDILNVSNPTITGANAGDFSVLSSFPINISGSNSVNVSLRCAPTGLTGRSANLAFTTNSSDPTETTVNYPLTCTGIAPVITMTPTTLTDAYEGQTTYSQIITASGGTPSYTLVETGALPTGMTFVGGVLSGTPAAGSAGTYNFTITATDSLLFSSAAQPYTLIVRPPIVVTPVTLPNGTVGVSYIQTIGATGGSGVYSNFAVTVGSLPPPLILNAGSGSITGTPSTPGTFPFSVTVTDSLGATGTLAYSVTINPGITVTPATLPNGTQGIPYTQTIGATGGSGTYTNFAVTIGSLPAPLILNAGSGAITGTPTTAGTFPFTVTVTDSLGGTGSQAYSVTINSAITVTPATLPGGTIGTAYNQTIGATGGSGTYTDFSVTAGSLPPPLLLNAGSGAITGTPTTTGTFPFTVTVTDSLGATGSLAYSVTINPAITVTPATLPNGTVGVAFNQTISATGGSGTYSNFAVTAGSLPAPLTLDATTGAITGTPPTAGTFPFTVTVTDSLGATGVQPYNLTIDPGSIVVQPATLPNGTVGVVYSQTISAIGGSGTYTDFSVTAGSLPPPLNLDPTTGAITGTPPTAGTFPFT